MTLKYSSINVQVNVRVNVLFLSFHLRKWKNYFLNCDNDLNESIQNKSFAIVKMNYSQTIFISISENWEITSCRRF